MISQKNKILFRSKLKVLDNPSDRLIFLKDLYMRKYTSKYLTIDDLSLVFECDSKYIILALKQLELYNTKQCNNCLQWLDYSNFHKISGRNTYHSTCIECNKERLKPISRRHYIENKSEIRKKANLNQNLRYATDPGFKLKKRLLNGIYNYLKNNKNDGIVKLLPYTMDELKTHLELQFDNSMNWTNYGSYWSLDHIRPISSFDIIDENSEDFLKCWGLSNLQPLENLKNFEKRDKYVAGT